VLLDVGNNDILDSGVGSIGSIAMGVWCKLVFFGGRGGVVPAAALVGLSIVFVASSSSALAPSSVASSSTPVEWGSSSVIVAVAAHGLAVAGVQSVCFNRRCSSFNRFGFPETGSGNRYAMLQCLSSIQ
jgi:hypothetical protein